MSDKLGIGASFPKLKINLASGGILDLPDGIDAKYGIVLFYRGHWCPYCRRSLAGFEKARPELDALGAKVVAASVDTIEGARIVAAEVSFPIGYGVARDTAESLGSWWEERRQFIQPSEFVVGADGKILASSYSDGPLGRIEGADVVRWIRHYESRK